eukprot:657975-Pleurochrysis_carterae.AAC.8
MPMTEAARAPPGGRSRRASRASAPRGRSAARAPLSGTPAASAPTIPPRPSRHVPSPAAAEAPAPPLN